MIRQLFCHGFWKPAASDFLFAVGCLSKDEQETAMRFRFQRDTMSSIVGKLLVRSNVVKQLGIPPSDVILHRSIKGKPYLHNSNGCIDFNISHGGDYTVFVSTTTGYCGVDVMRVDLPPIHESAINFVRKLKNIFSPNEYETILSHDDDIETMQSFYRHWCLKEAFVKALGCGLTVPLNTIECKLSDKKRPFVQQHGSESKDEWIFEIHELTDNHVAAVAWHGSNSTTLTLDEPFEQLSFDNLVHNLAILNPVDESTWMSFIEKPYSPPSARRKIQNMRNKPSIENTC